MSYLAFIDGETRVAHGQHVLLKALHFQVIVEGLAKDGEGLTGVADGLVVQDVALEQQVVITPVFLAPRAPLQRHVQDQLGMVNRPLQGPTQDHFVKDKVRAEIFLVQNFLGHF